MANGDVRMTEPMLGQDIGRSIADELLRSISGSGVLSNFLAPVINTIVREALGTTARFPFSPTTYPIGVSPVIGGQLPAADLVNFFTQSSINANLAAAENVLRQGRLDLREGVHTGLRGRPEFGAGWGPVNLMSDFLYATAMQPEFLLAGAEQMQRYMGVENPLFFFGNKTMMEAQMARNTNVREFTTNIITDYQKNPAAYAGLGGRDMGIVLGEMGRGGLLSVGGDANLAENKQLVQEAAFAVRGLRQFFEGDVGDLFDQINSLLRTSVLPTLGKLAPGAGGAGGAMSNMLAQAGAAAGIANMTPDQLVYIAQQSAAMSGQMGLNPSGAMANATTAALLLSQRAGPLQGEFIFEPALRSGIVREVTLAQQSPLARDIAGAYSILLGAGIAPGEAEKFIGGLDARFGGDVLAQMQGRFGEALPAGLTTHDLRTASFTAEGRRAMMRGLGTDEAREARINEMRFEREEIVRGVLGASGIDVSGFMGRLGGREFTEKNVRAALKGVPGATEGLIGEISMRFQDMVRFGDNPLFETPEAFENYMERSGRMEELQTLLGHRMDIQKFLGGKGLVAGARRLQQFITEGGDLQKADINALLYHIRGGTEIAPGEIQKLTEKWAGEGGAEFTGRFKELTEGADKDVAIGAAIASDIVFAGSQVGGNRAEIDKNMALARKALTITDMAGAKEAAKELSKSISKQDRFRFEVLADQMKIAKVRAQGKDIAEVGDVLTTGELAGIQENVLLGQVTKLGVDIRGLAEADRDFLVGTAQTILQTRKDSRLGITQEDLASEIWNKEDAETRQKNMTRFYNLLESADIKNEEIYGVESAMGQSPMTSLVELVSRMAESVTKIAEQMASKSH